jgi:hypothetical protein
VASALLAGLVGCARGPEFGEVRGKVTLDGQPLPEVEVVFLPDPERGTLGPKSSCYTDDQGRYVAQTSKGRDGVAIGFCRVCIHDIRALLSPFGGDAIKKAGAHGKEPDKPSRPRPPPPSRVPAAYASVRDTPLKAVEVKPGKNELNFELHGSNPAR